MGDSRQDTGLGLGARLRSARKARALGLEQAARALRLEVPILQALEEERFDRLGAPVFIRGHLKAYARLLGLSEASVLEAYRAADPGADSPRTMTRPREAPLNQSPGPWSTAAIAGLLLLGLGLYFLVTDPEPPPLPPAPAGAVMPAPVVTPAPVAEAVPADAPASPVSTPVPPAEPVAVPPPSAPEAPSANVLVLEFSEPSWVEVRDRSGRLLYTGEQSAASRQDVTGEAPFSVALGNVAGVRVTLDGTAFPIPAGAVAAGGNVARFRTDGGPTGGQVQ